MAERIYEISQERLFVNGQKFINMVVVVEKINTHPGNLVRHRLVKTDWSEDYPPSATMRLSEDIATRVGSDVCLLKFSKDLNSFLKEYITSDLLSELIATRGLDTQS